MKKKVEIMKVGLFLDNSVQYVGKGELRKIRFRVCLVLAARAELDFVLFVATGVEVAVAAATTTTS